MKTRRWRGSWKARDREGCCSLIGERNAAYGTWGFKLPMLCAFARSRRHGAVQRSARHRAIPRSGGDVGADVAFGIPGRRCRRCGVAGHDMAAMVAFVDRLRLSQAAAELREVAGVSGRFRRCDHRFCGLPQSNALRERLVGAIRPNRETYMLGARRRYEGIIEGVAGGSLYGWCRLTGVADPVSLDLFVDDRLAALCRRRVPAGPAGCRLLPGVPWLFSGSCKDWSAVGCGGQDQGGRARRRTRRQWPSGTRLSNGRLSSGGRSHRHPRVMPTQVGIHAFRSRWPIKSWMPTLSA